MTVINNNSKIIRFLFFPIFVLKKLYNYYLTRKIRIYKFLLSNVKEGSLVVNLIDIPGNFEIDVRSHILQRILIHKRYEPEIVALIKNNIDPQKDAINVGANIGIYTTLLSNLINNNHKVLAIEPTPLAFKYLSGNTERNGIKDKVLLFNGICSNTVGTFEINTIIGKEEYSSIGELILQTGPNEEIIKLNVKGEKIDNLVKDNKLMPGIIVIDVEGAEMKVIEGAATVLKEFKPIIISELDDTYLKKQGSSSIEVVDFLKKLNYTVRDVRKHKPVTYPFSGNIIAIPLINFKVNCKENVN